MHGKIFLLGIWCVARDLDKDAPTIRTMVRTKADLWSSWLAVRDGGRPVPDLDLPREVSSAPITVASHLVRRLWQCLVCWWRKSGLGAPPGDSCGY